MWLITCLWADLLLSLVGLVLRSAAGCGFCAVQHSLRELNHVNSHND